MKILTTITGTTVGGRNGHGTTSDGIVDIKFALPKELGGKGERGATPEHLFAIGYAACFGNGLQRYAGIQKIDLDPSCSVTAIVGLGVKGDGGFGLEVELQVKLPGIEKAKAEELVAKADKTCPYSNAIRRNVPVKMSII
jgi:lipoyl-dependent peroxiredoxin